MEDTEATPETEAGRKSVVDAVVMPSVAVQEVSNLVLEYTYDHPTNPEESYSLLREFFPLAWLESIRMKQIMAVVAILEKLNLLKA